MSTAMVPDFESPSMPSSERTPPRWLQVVSHTDPRYGGLSSAVPAMASSVAAVSRHDFAFAAFCNPGEEHCPTSIDPDELTFWPASRRAWLFDRTLKTGFASAVKQAHAVHVHGLWEESTAVACEFARKLGKPYVLSAHGMLEPWALAGKKWKKGVYAALIERANVAGATCLHALTMTEAQQYRDFGATGPIAVVPNAVDVPEEIGTGLFFNRFPELRGKRLVLFLSRLHPKKGLNLLIEGWTRLAAAFPDAQLVIAGPDVDDMRSRLMQDVMHRGIAGRVTFAGMLSGSLKWSALRAAECFVLPSYSEGLSMALLEAMGMGVPVIATRACNMPEITTANAGIEIDPTANQLALALEASLSQPVEERVIKGGNGARLIAERYSPARVANQMAAVYEYVLDGVPPQNVTFLPGGAR